MSFLNFKQQQHETNRNAIKLMINLHFSTQTEEVQDNSEFSYIIMINNSKTKNYQQNYMTDTPLIQTEPIHFLSGQRQLSFHTLDSPCKNKLKPDQMEEELNSRNQLEEQDPSISKKDWTIEEDELVYRLHNQYGNKWALIAEHLKGRSDNCIKNHFYSRLRKGLRKVNKLIEDCYKQEFKEFKIIDLYKVIEASDEKFKQINSYPNEMTDFGHDLKNRIFIFAEEESDGTDEFNIRANKLLKDLNEFTKNYKRKSKKCRRYSPMGVGSVYRNNSKKLTQTDDKKEELLLQKNEKSNNEKEQNKIQIAFRNENCPELRQRKTRVKKQQQKSSEISKQTTVTLTKKQTSQHITQEPLMIRFKSRNTFRKFSDDEGEQKDDAQYQREQRLDHFADNILKTFKSYYSFKSFKSHSGQDQPFFE